MTNKKHHTLTCTVSTGWFDFDITCPYDPHERDKPCAMYEDFEEVEQPTKFVPGCGAREWLRDSGEIEGMLREVSGELPLKVDTYWDGDGWSLKLVNVPKEES